MASATKDVDAHLIERETGISSIKVWIMDSIPMNKKEGLRSPLDTSSSTSVSINMKYPPTSRVCLFEVVIALRTYPFVGAILFKTTCKCTFLPLYIVIVGASTFSLYHNDQQMHCV
jgi:hypothetical protein